MIDFEQTALALLLAVSLGLMIVFLALLLRQSNILARLAAGLNRVSRWWRSPLAASEPFPPEWETYLRHNVGVYPRLTGSEQKRLQDLIQAFLPGREWTGCGGLEMTDEMRVTIGAQACILLLGMPEEDLYPTVQSILVYPSAFQVPGHTSLGEGGILQGRIPVLGEAWYRGPVILAWDEVLAGGQDPDDGRNVVYHEFAHQLDFAGESPEVELSAEMQRKHEERAAVLRNEFRELVRAAGRGRATLLDHYGAADPHEFFAVATECFFERGALMERMHPRLYAVLRDFYGQDSARRGN